MDPENADPNYHGIQTTYLLGTPTAGYPTSHSPSTVFYGTGDPLHTQQSELPIGAPSLQRDGSTHNPGTITSYSQGMAQAHGSYVHIRQQQTQHQPLPLLPDNSFQIPVPENRPISGGYPHKVPIYPASFPSFQSPNVPNTYNVPTYKLPIYPGTSLPSFRQLDVPNIPGTLIPPFRPSDVSNISDPGHLVLAESTRSLLPEVGNVANGYQPSLSVFTDPGYCEPIICDTYLGGHPVQPSGWSAQSYDPQEYLPQSQFPFQLSSLEPSNNQVSDLTWNQNLQQPSRQDDYAVQTTDFTRNHDYQLRLQSDRNHQPQPSGDLFGGNERLTQLSGQSIASATSSLVPETPHAPPSVSSRQLEPPPLLSSFQLSVPTQTIPQGNNNTSSSVILFSLSNPNCVHQHHPSSSMDLNQKFPDQPPTKNLPQAKRKMSNKKKRREETPGRAVIGQVQTTEKDGLSASSGKKRTEEEVDKDVNGPLHNGPSEDRRVTKKLKTTVDKAIDASEIFPASASSAAYEKKPASAHSASHPDVTALKEEDFKPPVETKEYTLVTPWSNEQAEFLLQSGTTLEAFFESLPSGVDWDRNDHQTSTAEDIQCLITFKKFLNEM